MKETAGEPVVHNDEGRPLDRVCRVDQHDPRVHVRPGGDDDRRVVRRPAHLPPARRTADQACAAAQGCSGRQRRRAAVKGGPRDAHRGHGRRPGALHLQPLDLGGGVLKRPAICYESGTIGMERLELKEERGAQLRDFRTTSPTVTEPETVENNDAPV